MSYLSRPLLFTISCLLAFLLIAFGLRLVFSPEILSSQLEKSYVGTAFKLQKGDFIKQKNGSIDVIGDILTDESRVSLGNLDIHTDYYQSIKIHLNGYAVSNREKNQLFVQFRLNDNHQTQPISVTFPNKETVISLTLADFLYSGKSIVEVSVFSPNLTVSYQLLRLEFIPKPADYQLFGQMLSDDLSTLFASHKHKFIQKNWNIVSPHLLVLLFFVSLILVYGYFLIKSGRNKLSAWWSTLVFTWLLLDVYFLKQQIKYEGVSSFYLPDWQIIIPALVKLISAWLLAISLILACLKKRYGYRFFAIGGGYIVAWLLLAVSDLIQQSFSWHLPEYIEYMIAGGEFLLACFILYFFKARNCSIEELRLEKSPSSTVYWSSRLLFLLIIGHVLLSAFYLSKVPFSETDIAKQLFSTLSYGNGTSFGNLICWTVSLLALGCLIFGALRYLGIHMMPATLGTYMLLSLPIWSSILIQSTGFSLLLLSINYTFIIISLVIVFSYHDVRSWFILLLSIGSLFVLGRYFILPNNVYSEIETTFSAALEQLKNNDVIIIVVNLLISESLYLTLLSIFAASIIFLVTRCRNRVRSQNMLLLFAVVGILPIIFVGQVIAGQENLFVWLISDAFWIIILPIVTVIPTTIFHLSNKDKDTLPTIEFLS